MKGNQLKAEIMRAEMLLCLAVLASATAACDNNHQALRGNEIAEEATSSRSAGDLTKALPPYPGATPMTHAEGFIRSMRADANATMFQTSDSVEEIKAFYSRETAKLGWKKSKSQRRQGMDVISYSVDGTYVHLIVEDTGDSRQVLIASRQSGDN